VLPASAKMKGRGHKGAGYMLIDSAGMQQKKKTLLFGFLEAMKVVS
jgi:hypothetical protein